MAARTDEPRYDTLLRKTWPWVALIYAVLISISVPPLFFTAWAIEGWSLVSAYGIFLTAMLFLVGIPISRRVWLDQVAHINQLSQIAGATDVLLNDQQRAIASIHQGLQEARDMSAWMRQAQNALAGLEAMEKICVLRANSYRARESGDMDWALYVTADARAIVPVYSFVEKEIRSELLVTMLDAFGEVQHNILERVDSLLERDDAERSCARRIDRIIAGMGDLVRDMSRNADGQDDEYMHALSVMRSMYDEHKRRWDRRPRRAIE